MSEIFVSYAAADRPRVEPLVQALEAEGLPVWWDRDIAHGETFHKVIEHALAAAPCVIVVWTSASVHSQWVLNEASDARIRGRLVPVLLEPITPPLEFRHLQAADLSTWTGDPDDSQFRRLRDALTTRLETGAAGRLAAPAAAPAGQRWQTRLALVVGGAAFMIGLSVLIFTLRQVGVIGPPQHLSDSGTATPSRPSDTQPPGRVQAPEASAAVPAGVETERVNLLDTDAGARLLYSKPDQEMYWNRIFTAAAAVAPGIVIGGFAVVKLPGDKAVSFDTLAILVENAYAAYGPKALALFTSPTSPEGPFIKAAQIAVPNHFIVQQPYQEFRFAPVEARFVKLQVLSSHASGTSAYVGTIHLYASSSLAP